MNRNRLSLALLVAGTLALPAVVALEACTAQQQTDFNTGLVTTTQNVVALNNALIQVNKTIVDNLIAQEKELAPYKCGAYALAAAIISDSTAASKVNTFIKSNVAANVSTVAVKDVCAALGYPTSVTAASPAPTPTPAATPAAIKAA